MKSKRSRKGLVVLACFLVLALAAVVFCVVKFVPFGDYDLSPQAGTVLKDGQFNYDLPLDPASPWPKFRANTLQNGRTPVEPAADPSVQPWEYRTAKGIFSSPVVDKDGVAYIGSADHKFYAINPDGTVKWQVQTGEIIDSSALLDDQGRIYFGSGDAKVYCCDHETGELLWTQEAATAAAVSEKFGIETYNVNWYEGNIGIMPDGTLLAPNDNYLLYRLNRETGAVEQRYLANEMIWSLPSINIETGNLFFGTVYSISNNVLSYDADSGEQRWKTGGIGATAATTMLTSYKENGGVVVGSYDGTLRCLSQKDGKTLWKLALRDHIYASPAQLSDGTIVQPGADGTVYGINPLNGEVKWVFDTLEPIRSSPAVDAADQIYFGSGEGKLFCLNKDGSLRWSYQCITEGRNDLNGSPALGYGGVYVAGESGEIFFVPYDYPLREENKDNPRCKTGETTQPLPADGGHLLYTTPLGGLLQNGPDQPIEANHALTFSLSARKDGRTILAQIDPKTLQVKVPGQAEDSFTFQVSAGKRYVVVVPKEYWLPDSEGKITVEITGEYKTGPGRFGMLFFGGKKSGSLDESYQFDIAARPESTNPFVYPMQGNQSATTLELRRQSIPNPCMLPSLNQIGFDSLHYLAGAVDEIGGKTIFWVIGGKKLADGSIVPDTASNVRFPLLMEYKDGLATLANYEGFKINFVGSWEMPLAVYRIGASFDPVTRQFGPVPTLTVTANCDEIEFYGPGLKLMGMSELRGGRMYASGSLELLEKEPALPPANADSIEIKFDGERLTADITGLAAKADSCAFGLLVTDPESERVMPLAYAFGTEVQADKAGTAVSVSLEIEKDALEKGRSYKVYLMADTYPAAAQMVTY